MISARRSFALVGCNATNATSTPSAVPCAAAKWHE